MFVVANCCIYFKNLKGKKVLSYVLRCKCMFTFSKIWTASLLISSAYQHESQGGTRLDNHQS